MKKEEDDAESDDSEPYTESSGGKTDENENSASDSESDLEDWATWVQRTTHTVENICEGLELG